MSATRRIGYVPKVFPRLSETFVVNEIRTLEGLGEDIRILSLHHGDREPRHGILASLRHPVAFVEDHPQPDDAVRKTAHRLECELEIRRDDVPEFLPRKYVRLGMALAELARQQGVTHLHAHFASRAAHVTTLAAHLAGLPFSFTAHAKDIYHTSVNPEVLRWKMRRARFVVTVTEFNRRYLTTLLGDATAARKIVRLYNGVDLDRFHPNGARPQPPLFVGIGRLIEKKGFSYLLDACAQLQRRGYSFGCDIIGEGDDKATLQEQIDNLGLSTVVHLRGALSTEDVARELRQSSALVLPCVVGADGNVDALPTVMLEAMASGCPVVSTAVSGIPEIVVEGETGFLVPERDATALATAMAKLLDDPAAIRSMGDAGRTRAGELFNLERNVRRLRDLFVGATP